ncbi:MAG TPA: hypothetical protein DEF45_15315 [Rhodopirellula sp.]|nr:hypothetical protein [Rhodopirellula sp.]
MKLNENECYTRMCVGFAWTAKEQKARRKRAASVQHKLLLSIVAFSIEMGTKGEETVPRADAACGEQVLRCSVAVEDHASMISIQFESLPT